MGCRLPTVNNFLFCLSLETGGTVLGWLSAIFSGIGIVSLGITFILLIIGYNNTTTNTDGTLGGVIALAIVCAIYILYLCLVFYASVQLIRGTKNRNAAQMKLYLILMAIGVILAFIQIFASTIGGVVGAIFSAIISAYFFICIYSLYQQVKGGS